MANDVLSFKALPPSRTLATRVVATCCDRDSEYRMAPRAGGIPGVFFFFDHEKALYRCSAISGPYLSHFDELFVIGRHRGPSTLAADTLLGGALVSLASILPGAIVMRIQVRPRFHHIC